jgi:predicted neutral ceramidase superfamily lipid hydrolase
MYSCIRYTLSCQEFLHGRFKVVRILLGLTIGMVLMGTSQAVIFRFLDGSNLVGRKSIIGGGEQFAALYGAIFGSVAGACIGGIAAGFKLPFPQSILLSLCLSVIASYIFYLKINEHPTRVLVQLTIACYLILGTLIGTLISFLNQTSVTSIFQSSE